MQMRCGKESFNYMPQTFCLPNDLEALKKVWDEEGAAQRWILKPVSEILLVLSSTSVWDLVISISEQHVPIPKYFKNALSSLRSKSVIGS